MEDEMHMVRLAWAELSGYEIDLHHHDDYVRKVPGTAVIDAKAIYDALSGRNQTHNMAERRTALELLAYMKDTLRNGTQTRWVHGDANIADSMTKEGAEKVILEFMKTFRWKIVNDELERSAKKRKKENLDRLEEITPGEPEPQEDFMTLLCKRLKQYHPELLAEDLESEEEDIEGYLDLKNFRTSY